MGRFFAWIYDRVMGRVETRCLGAWRRSLLADVAGDVLEVGAGTGANVAAYRWDRVRSVTFAEPDPSMRTRLATRLAGVRPVTWRCSGGTAERIDAPDHAFDSVVATLVLCSVADPSSALAEIHRVLRPGGCFVFLEHVAANEPSIARWQRRLEPLWRRCAGGCHLTRNTEAAIVRAGFSVESIERASMSPAPAIVRATIRGIARRGPLSGDRAPTVD